MKQYLIPALAIVALASCDDNGGGGSKNEPISIALTQEEAATVKSLNAMACKVFEALDGTDRENIVFSPLSAGMALSMAANGAAGNTLRQMQAVMCPDASLQSLNSLNAKLLRDLPMTDAGAKVRIANSLWHSTGFDVKPAFSQTLADSYSAAVTAYDRANSSAAAAAVNDWASKATEGVIKNLLNADEVPDSHMIANAAYFKAGWSRKFDKSATRPGPFHCADGSVVNTPMMRATRNVVYAEKDGMKLMGLPFGNEAYSMYMVLPAEGQTVAAATSAAVGIRQMVNGYAYVSLVMPRFSVGTKTDMSEVFRALGMADAFTAAAADFSALSDAPSYISLIKHACDIRVDEDGAEAAAATVIGGETAVGPGLDVVFDRPFGFFVVEESTGVVLFMGAVNKF